MTCVTKKPRTIELCRLAKSARLITLRRTNPWNHGHGAPGLPPLATKLNELPNFHEYRLYGHRRLVAHPVDDLGKGNLEARLSICHTITSRRGGRFSPPIACSAHRASGHLSARLRGLGGRDADITRQSTPKGLANPRGSLKRGQREGTRRTFL